MQATFGKSDHPNPSAASHGYWTMAETNVATSSLATQLSPHSLHASPPPAAAQASAHVPPSSPSAALSSGVLVVCVVAVETVEVGLPVVPVVGAGWHAQ